MLALFLFSFFIIPRVTLFLFVDMSCIMLSEVCM
jgi:hypothetical protein